MKYREIRKINSEDLATVCKVENWYTKGNVKQYTNLLYTLAEDKDNLKTEDILAIATDIVEHSNLELDENNDTEVTYNNGDESFTNICFKVLQCTYTYIVESKEV